MYTVSKGTVVNTDSVRKAIEENEILRVRYNDLNKYYIGQQPITQRTKTGALKNNHVMVNHAKYITDMNAGFLLGNEVEYSYEGEGKSTSKLDPVLNMYKEQVISEVDYNLGEKASIFGKSFEYVYTNEDGKCRSMDLDPINCIIAYDDTMEHGKEFAVIYSNVTEEIDPLTNKAIKKYKDVLVITKSDILYYNDDLSLGDVREHFHKKVPVIEYLNNKQAMGDFEQVILLIDAYNILQSDRVNDKEQLVEALLVLYGITLTPEQMLDLKDNRVMSVGMDARVEYLVKQLNETDVDILRKNLEQDIFKISMTPNFSDENFAGTASGVSLKYKLLAFQQNASKKERLFRKGLAERFELYNNFLIKGSKSGEIPTYDIDIIFKRNLPQNDLETSQMIMNLEGKVSDPTLISQLSFIENADDEVEWTEEQKVKDMNLQNQQFGTDMSSVNNAQDMMKNDVNTKKDALKEKLKSIGK